MKTIVRAAPFALVSTPNGKSGFFYDAFTHPGEHGGEGWVRLRVPATENPRIRPEQSERERSEMGPALFRQEFLCEFVEAGTHMFSEERIEAALNEFEESIAI